jgi:transcriptional regulator GlxA family with amidase domain
MKRIHKRSTYSVEAQYAYMRAHFREEIPIALLARRAGYSSAQFITRFRDAYGVTPKKQVMLWRLNRARMLLAVTDMSACAIATHCGYDDTYYFYKLFHRRFGVTPSEYRQKIRKEVRPHGNV